MSLEKSKWAKAKAEPKQDSLRESNPWKEVDIHESNLIVALEYAMRQTTQLKRSEVIERVLVGEPVNGVYPLSVAIKRKEE